VDKKHGWRGAPQRLDEKQLAAVLPAWRERLSLAKPQSGEVLVWDLGRVDPDEIEPDADVSADARRRVRVRPLEAGETYAVLVEKVEDKVATLDLGGAKGVIPFSDVTWARKFNPAVGTAAPKKMGDVLRPGDIVLARVVPGRTSPVDLARQGKPLALSLEQVPKLEGALVAIDPATRGVRALVGGQDFGRSQFNRAIQAKRQPGSAFKPFVWGAAIESGRFTAATMVYDTPDLYRDPWTGKEWKPQNFEKDVYEGPMLVLDALAHSKNTVSAKLCDALGVEAVIDFARRAGIESELPRTLSLALGTGEVTPMELVNAYATLAAGGWPAPPILITRVRDRNGAVLEETKPSLPPPLPEAAPSPPPHAAVGSDAEGQGLAAGPTPVPAAAPTPAVGRLPDRIRPEAAFVTLAMMKEVVQRGTGQGAKVLDRPVAAKTGTAQEHRDAWFVGMTPDLVAGVWVGFDGHEPLGAHATGAGAALPGWIGFMQAAVGGKPAIDFTVPPGVEMVRIDPGTGLLATGATDGVLVPFMPGTAPSRTVPEPSSTPQNFFQDDH
jgi:penicillin-binding protein 1A